MSIQLSGEDIVDLAVQTEARGELFYREAAERASLSEAKELFRYLAEQEVQHKRIFIGLASAIVTSTIDATTWAETVEYIAATVDRAFFAPADAPIRTIPQGASIAEMVRTAIEFEKQTLLFFYTLRDLVQPANRPVIDRIVEEEKSHVRQLAAVLSRKTVT